MIVSERLCFVVKVLFKDVEVQKLLDDYQKLIGVRIAVFDTEFNELYSSPSTLSPFCQQVRTHKAINDECKYCDQKAFRQAKANKDIYIYKCHMGLYEAVTPLFDKEQILGYVMIGQVLDTSNKEIQWQLLSKKYRYMEDAVMKAKTDYYNLKQMSLDDIEAVSRIMKACAISIWLQHIIDVERSPITERIDNYIGNHYTEKITTDLLCEDLAISKTTVYKTLKEEHNMSLTKYINHHRLLISKELLVNKKTPPIADVATEVGFDDYNYYTRLFKLSLAKHQASIEKNLQLD